jgi:opine dehydrogenase
MVKQMDKKRKIAVLGGGHGAHTMAADLTMKGFEINMCEAPEFEENIKTTIDRQAIDLIDVWGKKHTVEINLVTTNFKQALEGASYIMMVTPAIGSSTFFNAIIPFLEDGQTIIKWSANFSALSFGKILKDKGIKKNITLAEAHTLPWGCRLMEPGTVQIMVWAVKLLLATLPSKNIDTVIEDVRKMYPVVSSVNVLGTTLNNLNPIVHPIGVIMNAGWIDSSGKDFYFYRDGTTLSISRGIKAVFEEVSKVAGALDVKMLEYPEDDFWRKSTIMSTYFRATFDKEGAAARISGPSSVNSRYITEDLPFGLVPISKLAKQFNVSTPVIDSVIAISSVINHTNYLEEGISLKDLGIEGLSRSELKQVLDNGFIV